MAAKKLTDKQERFCQEYLIDSNATQAAIRAGYSEKTAEQQGYQLIQKTLVSARLSELKAEQEKRTKITADMVINEWGKIAFSDMKDFLKSDLSIKKIEDMGEKSAVISSVKISQSKAATGDDSSQLTEFKLHDKLKALDALSRYFGIYEKDNDQKKENQLPTNLTELIENLSASDLEQLISNIAGLQK